MEEGAAQGGSVSGDGMVTLRELARRLHVSYETVRHWMSRFNPGPDKGVYHLGRRAIRVQYAVFLREFLPLLNEQPVVRRRRKKATRKASEN